MRSTHVWDSVTRVAVALQAPQGVDYIVLKTSWFGLVWFGVAGGARGGRPHCSFLSSVNSRSAAPSCDYLLVRKPPALVWARRVWRVSGRC